MALMMEAISTPGTWDKFHQTFRRYIPEHSHLLTFHDRIHKDPLLDVVLSQLICGNFQKCTSTANKIDKKHDLYAMKSLPCI
jgi:hypothetical protein